MTNRGSDDLEQQLRALREQQAQMVASGQGGGAQAQALAREIVAVAGRLGFDPDEAAAIAGQVEAPASGPGHAMAGEYRVLRGPAAPIFAFSGLVIGAAVIGLGQPTAGAGLIIAVLTLYILQGRLRVARITIDASGALSFPGHLARFDPAELLGIDFAYRYPIGAPEHKKAALETVDLRLRLARDRSITLAHGPLWRTAPRREPVAYAQLERHLSAQAKDAGLKIERSGAGWTAHR
jgi:hypothetical protein